MEIRPTKRDWEEGRSFALYKTGLIRTMDEF